MSSPSIQNQSQVSGSSNGTEVHLKTSVSDYLLMIYNFQRQALKCRKGRQEDQILIKSEETVLRYGGSYILKEPRVKGRVSQCQERMHRLCQEGHVSYEGMYKLWNMMEGNGNNGT